MGNGGIQNFDDTVLWEYPKITPKKILGFFDKNSQKL